MTALAAVDEMLVGPDSIPVQLRARQGLDRARFDRLILAIRFLVTHYSGQEHVPKRLALAFVDISNYFYYTEQHYDAQVLEQIEDAGFLLTQLASELFSDG